MDMRPTKNGILLIKPPHFAPAPTLCCGQAFRWHPLGKGYVGVVAGRVLHVCQRGEDVALWPCTPEDFEGLWRSYFALDTDYTAILTGLSGDAFLEKCLAYGSGLRVLNQPPFETLISFILSANNNVRRIQGLVERLCRRYGRRLRGGGEHYAFPQPAALAAAQEADLRTLGMGYRAPYVRDTAAAIAGGYDLAALRTLPYEQAKRQLRALPGVGPKVADCVLLFSLGFSQAFVQDVWINRVLDQVYNACGDAAARERVKVQFGANAGILQQYMFYFARAKGKVGLAG